MTRYSVEILACLSGAQASCTQSCSFDNAVRETLRFVPNVSEVEEKEKTYLNVLVKRKDIFGLLPSGFGKSLIY